MQIRHAGLVVAAALAASLLAACGSSADSATTTSATTTSATVWLCRPGVSPDYCAGSLSVTAVSGTGVQTVTTAVANASSPFDCFYVYPTVSTQRTDNANLKIQEGEIGAAISQASPFSQVCRVYAPMYRQRTEESLLKGLGNDPAADSVAYQSLLSGWRSFLAHDDDGRPIIFVGHSQGAAMLIRLLRSQVDTNAALRRRVVAAILLGGNVAVRTGSTSGGTFAHLSLCTSTRVPGCVIAYSSFPSAPPVGSPFGRPGQGVSLQSDQTASAHLQVACVNPAALGGGTAQLAPWFLNATANVAHVTTTWVSFPALYSAACAHANGATWLQVTDIAAAGDTRPVVSELLGPSWGYHADDVNLALGDLVSDVAALETSYQRAHLDAG